MASLRKCWSWGNPISMPEVVQTLDECLVIIPKKIFDDQGFDAITCDGWDLYAVDYCLSIKRIGRQAYAIPMFVYHGSMGNLTERYFSVLNKVLNKHKKYFKMINTTTGSWSTSYPINVQRKYIAINRIAFCLLIYQKGPHQTVSMGPIVSIIVLNWNGWRDKIQCLESLYQISYPIL